MKNRPFPQCETAGFFRQKTPLVVAVFACQPNILWVVNQSCCIPSDKKNRRFKPFLKAGWCVVGWKWEGSLSAMKKAVWDLYRAMMAMVLRVVSRRANLSALGSFASLSLRRLKFGDGLIGRRGCINRFARLDGMAGNRALNRACASKAARLPPCPLPPPDRMVAMRACVTALMRFQSTPFGIIGDVSARETNRLCAAGSAFEFLRIHVLKVHAVARTATSRVAAEALGLRQRFSAERERQRCCGRGHYNCIFFIIFFCVWLFCLSVVAL